MFYVFGMFLPPSSFVQCWYCVYISKILDYCLFSFFFFFLHVSATSACTLPYHCALLVGRSSPQQDWDAQRDAPWLLVHLSGAPRVCPCSG